MTQNELFLKAAALGDIEGAIEALQAGADLNAVSVQGNNALNFAGERHRKDFFDWILQVNQKGKTINVNHINDKGNTVLLSFIKENLAPSYIDSLIEAGAQVDMPSKDGITPLIYACAHQQVEAAQVLLKNEANPNLYVDKNRTNPFLMACAEGNLELVELMFDKVDFNATDSAGRNGLLNALFRFTEYMKKKEKEKHNTLESMLVEATPNINHAADTGMTAIFMASCRGNKDLVYKMLDKGANCDVWHDFDHHSGNTSILHTWCRIGEKEVVEKLLAGGGKLSVPDESGNTVEALAFRVPALRQLMLDNNADVNAVLYIKNEDPNKPQHAIPSLAAVISGGDSQIEITKQMIDKGASLKVDEDKHDPLYLAIISSAPETVKLLIEAGLDVNKRLQFNPELKNPITVSYMQLLVNDFNNKKISEQTGQKQYLESLIKAKKENEKNGIVSDIIPKEGFEQIEKHLESLDKLADLVQENKKKIFNYLIDAGFNINQRNEEGRSAVFNCQNLEMFELLKAAGADLTYKDKQGNDLLTWAITQNYKDLIPVYKELKTNLDNIYYNLAFTEIATHTEQAKLEAGIVEFAGGENLAEKIYKDKEKVQINNINYQDSDGNSALLVACANDMPFLVSLYHKLGGDLNLSNHAGETPLMHALATKNDKLIEFLVKNGADCSAKTSLGKSVLDLAEEINKFHISKLIKSHMEEPKEETKLKI